MINTFILFALLSAHLAEVPTDAGQTIINLTYNCTNSAEKSLMSRGQLLTCALQMSTVSTHWTC